MKLVWFSFFVFRYSNWVGKSYFDIQNPILTIALSRKILFWYSKSILTRFSDSVRKTKNENQTNFTFLVLQCSQISAVLLRLCLLFMRMFYVSRIKFEITSKYDFECQNRVFRLSLNVKIRFWMLNYDFPTVRISENEKRKAKKDKTKIKPTSPCLQSPSLTWRYFFLLK